MQYPVHADRACPGYELRHIIYHHHLARGQVQGLAGRGRALRRSVPGTALGERTCLDLPGRGRGSYRRSGTAAWVAPVMAWSGNRAARANPREPAVADSCP